MKVLMPTRRSDGRSWSSARRARPVSERLHDEGIDADAQPLRFALPIQRAE
jgi:hypothetical protein